MADATVRVPIDNPITIRKPLTGTIPRGASVVEVGSQVGAQVACIVAGAVDERRPAASQDRQPDDIHTWGGDDPAIVAHTAS